MYSFLATVVDFYFTINKRINTLNVDVCICRDRRETYTLHYAIKLPRYNLSIVLDIFASGYVSVDIDTGTMTVVSAYYT